MIDILIGQLECNKPSEVQAKQQIKSGVQRLKQINSLFQIHSVQIIHDDNWEYNCPQQRFSRNRRKSKKCQKLLHVRHFTCVGDFLSCKLGLTLRKPLAARDELLASPFLRPSVTLCARQESENRIKVISHMRCVYILSNGVTHSFVWHVQFQVSTREPYPILPSVIHSLGNRKHSNNTVSSTNATNVNCFEKD